MTSSDAQFTQLVDAHYAALYRFALSLARTAADAADLTQQTFFIWARQGHQLRDGSKAKTWLFTTLYREFLRSRRRGERVTSLDEMTAAGHDTAAEEISLPVQLDSQLVVEALQEIEPAYRAPLTLFYLQDLSYKEIADVLDVPIGTVMSRLSRGKLRLRALLQEKAQQGKVIDFPGRQSSSAP